MVFREFTAARRGFGWTGQDSLLRPYHLAAIELPKTFTGLRDLVVDPGQQAKLKALEPHVAALLQLSGRMSGSDASKASARITNATG